MVTLSSDRLTQWLRENEDTLVHLAVRYLSDDDQLKTQAVEIVAQFFTALTVATRAGELTEVHQVIDHWIEARSAPTEGEWSRLMPLLATLKQANIECIMKQCDPAEAAAYIVAFDNIYTRLSIYLSQREADTLLADMRQQLAAAEEQLARLDKSKSDFIAVAAHELRTPITLIEGYANMMRMTYSDTNAQPMLEGIDNGVRRLREIIRDMIDVSLISLGMIELHFQPTWLAQVLDALERSLQQTLQDRDLEIQIDYAAVPEEPIYADTERILQVMRKIVTNAIKYTPDGGRIQVTARSLPGFVDLMVTDSGIGIAAEQLPHIFSMFAFTGDASLHSSSKTKFRGGGPGLGLFISKGLVEAHGGNIWAESPGYDEDACPGSTFHVLIPLRTSPPVNALIIQQEE